jgi:hypothetical protein
VAGAQSWPPQHSFGYQSLARTLPVTAKIIAASSIFDVFNCPLPPLPVDRATPERRPVCLTASVLNRRCIRSCCGL